MKKETPQSIEKTVFSILQMLLFKMQMLHMPTLQILDMFLTNMQFWLWNFKLLILHLKISNSFLNFLIYLFIYLCVDEYFNRVKIF